MLLAIQLAANKSVKSGERELPGTGGGRDGGRVGRVREGMSTGNAGAVGEAPGAAEFDRGAAEFAGRRRVGAPGARVAWAGPRSAARGSRPGARRVAVIPVTVAGVTA
ncbi:hypothetical protein GCM10023094_33740 [Rhodococcus olei]|uniref:Uncharacterized protein n=1 Tax=Rhodococcus olei TaxID=2161675 RepID=A0ABP8P6Z4_9NOCA